MQIVGCRKLLRQGLELSDGESCRAGSKAAVLGRRRAFVGALCMVSRRAWRDLFLLRVLQLGAVRLVRHPRNQRRRGGTRDWHRKHHGIKNQTISTSIRKIKSRLAPLSLAPLRSLAEVSGAADPLQPKSLTPWKTRSPCNSFSCTALPATTLATSVVAPVTVVPSVVRTLRLSLLHSH